MNGKTTHSVMRCHAVENPDKWPHLHRCMEDATHMVLFPLSEETLMCEAHASTCLAEAGHDGGVVVFEFDVEDTFAAWDYIRKPLDFFRINVSFTYTLRSGVTVGDDEPLVMRGLDDFVIEFRPGGVGDVKMIDTTLIQKITVF